MTTGLALLVAFLIVATLVPFTYEKTVGYDATFAGIESPLDAQTLLKAVEALGYGNASINTNSHGDLTDYTVAGLPSEDAVREVGAALYTLTGYDRAPQITPVKSKVSGTLYAQARDRLIEVQVDASGKSDAEIRAEIIAKLAEQGVTANDVSVNTDANGNRQIDLSVEGEGDANGEMEVRLGVFDANGDVKFGSNDGMSLDLAGTENMSEAELKAHVEQQLESKGITGVDVNVSTDANGKHKVELGTANSNWSPKTGN
jgi:hypothetical protein